MINHGPRHLRQIALTFDDGPSQDSTEGLLEALDELGVKVTFFCVGLNAQINPQIIQRAFQAGHVIGNHSWRHGRGGSLHPLADGEHIDRSARQIADVIGVEPRLYRPPWGWLTPWESHRLHERGYTIVGWDVYTLDWQLPVPDGASIADQVRREARPGSIILFHDGFVGAAVWHKTQTVEAVRLLVPALRDQGFEFVTVPTMLNLSAYTPQTGR